MSNIRGTTARRWSSVVLGAAFVVAGPAAAQAPYKVVGADGRITYTDRPPTGATDSRVARVGVAAAPTVDAVLPLELRQAVGRYPVTLYVTGDDCGPCATARDFLRRRGVPFAERTVQTPEDVQAFERLSGSRDAPTVTIGAQVLRGLTTNTWDDYLDAAGYPRESRLPANYRYPAPMPLVARATVAPGAQGTAAADPAPTLPSLPASEGPIRF